VFMSLNYGIVIKFVNIMRKYNTHLMPIQAQYYFDYEQLIV